MARRDSCPHACGGEPVNGVPQGLPQGDVVPTPVGVNRPYLPGVTAATYVVPTPVGVNRPPASLLRQLARSCPHACGGEPSFALEHSIKGMGLSPRLWG